MNVSSMCGRAKAGLALGLVLAVTACIVVIDAGIEGVFHFHFEGYAGVLPPGATPVKSNVTVNVPGLGEFQVNVFDTDGDGAGDTAGPVPPDGKYVKGYMEAAPQAKHQITGGGSFSDASGQQVHKQEERFVVYEKAPAVKVPVAFEKSVSAYLAQYGLDDVREGDNETINLIDVLGASADATVPSGISLDVRLHWNTEAGWVDIGAFPSLQYEFYGLADVPDTWPHYVVLRVVGDSGAVLNWLAHHGVTDMDFYNIELDGAPAGDGIIDHVNVQIHEGAGFAQISIDGSIHFVPLNS